jgi:peptide chain release factor 1
MSGGRSGGVFDIEILEERPGIVIFRAHGSEAQTLFNEEAGGHRFQRVPETEKRGRVQTSTVTVAVLPEPDEVQFRLDPRDVDISTCRGSGPGGQKSNKTECAVQATHIPSGLQVRCESERSQHQNRASALALLRARLWQAEKEKVDGARAGDRRLQIGSGMRGDKRRTIAMQRDSVVDHVTGRRWNLKTYLRGEW